MLLKNHGLYLEDYYLCTHQSYLYGYYDIQLQDSMMGKLLRIMEVLSSGKYDICTYVMNVML